MEAKFTPGPWTFDKRDGDEWYFGGKDGAELVIYRADGRSYESFAVLAGAHSSDLNEANARLIAAAPDLLAALRLLVKASNETRGGIFPDDYTREIDAALVAIAKATGEAA